MSRRGSLSGLRVIDLGQIVAGPLCSFYLASLGADVIRIDRTEDDWSWTIPPVVRPDGSTGVERGADDIPLGHLRRGRGKRSVGIDLKTPEGVEILSSLAAGADIVIENQRPGALEAIGFTYPAMSARNERLIWCSVKGYAQDDPRYDEPAIDITVQARSGLMYRTGEPDGMPMRVPSTIVDHASAIFAAFGVMSALRDRERTGRGSFLEVSMLDVMLSILWDEPLDQWSEDGLPLRPGNDDVRGGPFGTFPTADGWVTIVASSQQHWQRLSAIIGSPELAERYPSPQSRAAARDTVDRLVSEWTSRHTSELVEKVLGEAGIPVGAVLHPLDALVASRAESRGLFERLRSAPGAQPSRFVAPLLPIRFDGDYMQVPPAEPLGRSTGEIVGSGRPAWPEAGDAAATPVDLP